MTLEDGKTFEADYLLVAVGRGPATAGLGYEEAASPSIAASSSPTSGCAPASSTSGRSATSCPGLQLAHRGFQQGIFVAEEIAGLRPVLVPDAQIPKVTYCHPEVASVGLTEAQAVDGARRRRRSSSYEYNLAGNGKSEILGTVGTRQGRPR